MAIERYLICYVNSHLFKYINFTCQIGESFKSTKVYNVTVHTVAQSIRKWSSLPFSTFSPLFPDDCCALLMVGACFFTSAVIFGEQFLREGRAVITGGTCNNLSN